MTPPSKKARKESPAPAPDCSIQYCSYHYDEEYSIHEKYDLQDALSNMFHGNDVAIIKLQRIPEEDEMNTDLSAFFLHRTEEGLATHQGTNVQVPPWRILHQGGRASQIRKATEEYHILVWLPEAFLRRPKGKVPVRQSRTTLETRVRTHFWIMGEDPLLFSLNWVRTPYQRSGWGHPLGSLGEDTPPATPFLG